jgi:hypothetical protein
VSRSVPAASRTSPCLAAHRGSSMAASNGISPHPTRTAATAEPPGCSGSAKARRARSKAADPADGSRHRRRGASARRLAGYAPSSTLATSPAPPIAPRLPMPRWRSLTRERLANG